MVNNIFKLDKIRKMDINNSKPMAFMIIFLVVFFIGVVVIQSTFDNAVIIESTAFNSSQIVLTNSTVTLDPHGVVITSSEVKANNNSWMEFDGVNDIVDISPSFVRPITNGTISVWANAKDLESNGEVRNGRLVQLGTSQGNIKGFQLRYASTFGFQCFAGNGTDEYNAIIPAGTLNDTLNVWTHYACVFNGTDIALYKNGILNITDNNDTGLSMNLSYETASRKIGSFSDGNGQFSGGIDEVRIYNSSLTALEITEIYNSGRISNSSLPSSNLRVWYSFDEATGTTVYDKSGNGNNGE